MTRGVSALATLEATAQALLTAGKGILAADESFPTIGKRFTALDIPSTEENRLAYREMLFTTARPERVYQRRYPVRRDDPSADDRRRVHAGDARRQGIIPGIKVDKGTIALPNFAGEKFTQGLDGLRERLGEYRELGARFTKWRAVIAIGEDLPTTACIEVNARALALFAALSQEAGLVPIVEPEVLMDGNHTLARCEEVTRETLECVFDALFEHRVAA